MSEEAREVDKLAISTGGEIADIMGKHTAYRVRLYGMSKTDATADSCTCAVKTAATIAASQGHDRKAFEEIVQKTIGKAFDKYADRRGPAQ